MRTQLCAAVPVVGVLTGSVHPGHSRSRLVRESEGEFKHDGVDRGPRESTQSLREDRSEHEGGWGWEEDAVGRVDEAGLSTECHGLELFGGEI